MTSSRRGRSGFILAAVFLAALLGVGAFSLRSSGYQDVAQLASYTEPVQGLAVKGSTVPLEPGVYYLKVGDTVFKLTVSKPSLFAKAERVAGPRLGGYDSYAFFMMRGGNGFTVAALLRWDDFAGLYGGENAVMESQVVVKGTYNPGMKAVLVDAGGRPVAGPMPVILVDKILEGCHSSYGSGAAKA